MHKSGAGRAVLQQDAGAEQIGASVQQLDRIAQEYAASAEEMSATAENLLAQAEQVLQLTANFQIKKQEDSKQLLVDEQ